MPSKSYLSHAVAKPLIASISAALMDRLLMKNLDIKSNIYFGGSVGAGIFSVSWVEPIIAPYFPTNTPMGHIGKALEGRIVEIALGSAASYSMNRFILKNEYTNNDLFYKLGIVIVSDLIGESLCEVLAII